MEHRVSKLDLQHVTSFHSICTTSNVVFLCFYIGFMFLIVPVFFEGHSERKLKRKKCSDTVPNNVTAGFLCCKHLLCFEPHNLPMY